MGRALQEARAELEAAWQARREALEREQLEARLRAQALDLTLPGTGYQAGAEHPVSRTIREILEIFRGMGFDVEIGPEIETEWYNFEALNIPADHPARDEQDSFYLGEGRLLRTQTSPVQIRVMERRKPPFRIVSPGRVYRRDPFDARHSPCFFQIEGLMVGEGVRFSDLKGVLRLWAAAFFGEVPVRFRPSYFPFTEPSAEMDVACILCEGKGCAVCHYTGWLEILGAGMVHPQVFRNVGYDPGKVTGFAFGMGPDRIAMLKYRIPDIRMLYENDFRLLRQFTGV